MRIFEVKNNLVKIFYEAKDYLFLSGFLMIKDSRESYIGQIMHLESSKHGNIAIAKLIFNVTEDGVITSYSGSVPAINSAISTLSSINFLKLIQGIAPVIIGELIEKNLLVSLDKSFLENKLVICSENSENSDYMFKTLNQQIKNYGKKTIIIDTDGLEYFDRNTFIASDTFKLPINHQLIDFIYEKGIEYKSARSKAILQETFLELQYYLSTIDEKYIPIDKFIDILEKQYEDSKIPELVLLKNALLKFDEADIFANDPHEYKVLLESLLNNQTTVLNLANVDEDIQRECISYVYSLIQDRTDDYYVFVKINNNNSDKKLLKQIFSTKNAFTSINCDYSYKYLSELKKIAKDLILFSPIIQQQDFASYNTFLNKLGRTEFIVYGKATQYMPLIVKLSEKALKIKTTIEPSVTPEEAQELVQKQLKEQQRKHEQKELEKEEAKRREEEQKSQVQQQMQQMQEMMQQQALSQQMYSSPQVCYPQQMVYPQMFAHQPMMQSYMTQPFVQPFMQPQPMAMQPQVMPQMQSMVQQPVPNNPTPVVQNSKVDAIKEEKLPEPIIEKPPVFQSIEPQEMPQETFEEVKAEVEINNAQITEEDLDSIQDNDIFEDLNTTQNTVQAFDEDEVDEEAHQVYATNEFESESLDTNEEYLEIVESSNEEAIEDESYLDEIRPAEDLSNIPVYDENEGLELSSVNSESIERGDLVVHEEFGNGTVEKVINYGKKKLCSINFEGKGRKLLDPTTSELKKINS